MLPHSPGSAAPDDFYRTLTVLRVQEIVPGVKTIYFAEPSGNLLSYRPGQYLTLTQPGPEAEIRRSYSIISVPELQEPLGITVKRVENGYFSRYLTDKVRPGDQLLATGAGGFFTLPEDLSAFRQVFFMAAGSGITPIFALLKEVL